MVCADGESFQFWPPEMLKNYPISDCFWPEMRQKSQINHGGKIFFAKSGDGPGDAGPMVKENLNNERHY